MRINEEMYRKYDVIAVRTNNGLEIVHSTLLNMPKVFESEESLNDRVLRENPNADYIVLDRIDG